MHKHLKDLIREIVKQNFSHNTPMRREIIQSLAECIIENKVDFKISLSERFRFNELMTDAQIVVSLVQNKE